ncbi:MAG: hypothetical protein Q7T82_16410 [Armatimonadota bacterium]|nr:hypothetical protein [Armatimonadota bacterium]
MAGRNRSARISRAKAGREPRYTLIIQKRNRGERREDNAVRRSLSRYVQQDEWEDL